MIRRLSPDDPSVPAHLRAKIKEAIAKQRGGAIDVCAEAAKRVTGAAADYGAANVNGAGDIAAFADYPGIGPNQICDNCGYTRKSHHADGKCRLGVIPPKFFAAV